MFFFVDFDLVYTLVIKKVIKKFVVFGEQKSKNIEI